MPNKTIYVSQQDEELFEMAKELSGGALSTVISKALKEFVSKHADAGKDMKEVKIMVGAKHSQREQRFIAKYLGKWEGFDDTKDRWLKSEIYLTQKGNLAIYHRKIDNAHMITDPNKWTEYIGDTGRAELIVGKDPEDLKGKIPEVLLKIVQDLAEKEVNPSEFLDI